MQTPRNQHVVDYYKAQCIKWCEKRNAAEYGSVIEGYEELATRYAKLWAQEIDYTSFVPGIVQGGDGCTLIIA